MFRSVIILCFAIILPLPGARITFEGLNAYSRSGILEAIAGRLDYISDRPATAFRADDAAYLVETYLRDHGLPDALVTSSLPGNDTILLKVNEGPPKYLGPVTVSGYQDTEAIRKQFEAAFPESENRRAFDREAIERGIERVTKLLNSEGYWEASTQADQERSNSANISASAIPFTLKLKTGTRFTLTQPVFNSPITIPAELTEKLASLDGRVATAKIIIKARKTVSEAFRAIGYPDIEVEMTKETHGARLRLRFTIQPGQKYQVRSLAIQGSKKTKPDRLRARFTGIIGEDFDKNRINAEIKKLLATGAFESMRLETDQVSTTELDLTLHLTEAKARGYSFSAGAGSFEGFIIGARYYDRNLYGRLWNLSSGFEFTSLGLLGEISITNPFFLNQDLAFNTRGYLITRDFDSYDKKQGGLSAQLSWKRGDHYSASLGYEIAYTDIESNIPAQLIGPGNYLVNRISFQQAYDKRDDPTLPANGWFAKWDNTIGIAAGDQQIGYLETSGQLSYYKSLGENSSYALSLRGGVIVPTGDRTDLPIDLRKFLGGANTIRSFPEREMGPEFSGDPLGGTHWWVANAEYLRKIAGPLKGVIFVDTGALDGETEIAAGLGLRLDLPIGPVRLEYGRSLSQDSGEPGGAFHFAIGTTF